MWDGGICGPESRWMQVTGFGVPQPRRAPSQRHCSCTTCAARSCGLSATLQLRANAGNDPHRIAAKARDCSRRRIPLHAHSGSLKRPFPLPWPRPPPRLPKHMHCPAIQPQPRTLLDRYRYVCSNPGILACRSSALTAFPTCTPSVATHRHHVYVSDYELEAWKRRRL
jgi:hypothetical protein